MALTPRFSSDKCSVINLNPRNEVVAYCDHLAMSAKGVDQGVCTKSHYSGGENRTAYLSHHGNKVIIDTDLAKFYGVSTKRLNEQVKRNKRRFPEDFVFQLTAGEKAEVVANCDHLAKLKFSKALPYAFTEHDAIMAAGVLNSERAVEVSIFIVRAFVRLRRAISEHKELAGKIAQLERHLADHDETISMLIQAIKQLMNPALPPKRRRIGFRSDKL